MSSRIWMYSINLDLISRLRILFLTSIYTDHAIGLLKPKRCEKTDDAGNI